MELIMPINSLCHTIKVDGKKPPPLNLMYWKLSINTSDCQMLSMLSCSSLHELLHYIYH